MFRRLIGVLYLESLSKKLAARVESLHPHFSQEDRVSFARTGSAFSKADAALRQHESSVGIVAP